MHKIIYTELCENNIETALFDGFNRYQEVNKCWRKENERWELKEIVFTESWDADAFEFLVKCLKNTVKMGGIVYGAFEARDKKQNESKVVDGTEIGDQFGEKVLVGFVSVENYFFGSHNEYLQLSSLHTSYEKRGLGIGRQLFELACESAKELGAQKLYISAHSSEETQAFLSLLAVLKRSSIIRNLLMMNLMTVSLSSLYNE